MRLWDKHWSEQLAKEAVWLSGLVTFEQAADILTRVGQSPISSSSAWQRSAKWGAQMQAVEAQQRAVANALPARSEVVPGELSSEQILGVAMDGAMVHVRQEGWKELKTGCIFEVEVRPTLDKTSGEMMELAHATANTYVAHLGGTRIWAARASLVSRSGRRPSAATGRRRTTVSRWAMGRRGSGTWCASISRIVAKRWIGTTPSRI